MRTITINAKCSDMCQTIVKVGGETYEKEGYAPYLDALRGGDYLEFTIDLDTGTLLKWKPLTDKQAIALVKGEEDDEDGA